MGMFPKINVAAHRLSLFVKNYLVAADKLTGPGYVYIWQHVVLPKRLLGVRRASVRRKIFPLPSKVAKKVVRLFLGLSILRTDRYYGVRL